MHDVLLTIIIHHHGPSDRLFDLLQSIMEQSFKKIEVIIIHNSVHKFTNEQNTFQFFFPTIQIIQNETFEHLLYAYLHCMRIAKGQLLAFACTNGLFQNNQCLEKAINVYFTHQADIVQLQSNFITDTKTFAGARQGIHIPQQLDASAILKYSDLFFTLDSKIYSKKIWLELIPVLMKLPLQSFFDEAILLFFYTFKVKKYICTTIGYYCEYIKIDAPCVMLEKYIALSILNKHFNEIFPELTTDIQQLITAERYLHTKCAFACGELCFEYWNNSQNRASLPEAIDIFAFIQGLLSGIQFNLDRIRQIKSSFKRFLQ